MSKKKSYQEYQINFPDYIILKNAGYFYDVKNYSALFFSEKLGYSLYENRSCKYNTGIPANLLPKAIELLKNSNYKYIIIRNDKIIEQYDDGISIPQIENLQTSINKNETPIKQKTRTRKKSSLEEPTFNLNSEQQTALIQQLKKYRKTKADISEIPAYCIFNNKTLDEIVKYLPTNKESLMKIYGFRNGKFTKYGDDLLGIINNFLAQIPEFTNIQDTDTVKNNNDIPELSNKRTNVIVFKSFNFALILLLSIICILQIIIILQS